MHDMEESLSNKTILSDITGGFAIMPNALIGFISDKACAVFLKIYQCQFTLDKVMLDGEEWVQISGPYFATALCVKHRNTINNAINELLGFNLIKRQFLNRKQVLYCINWEEILFDCKVLCGVNFDGRDELHKACVRNEIVPISQLPDDVRNEIVRNNPNKQCSYDLITNPPMFVMKSYESDTVRNEIVRTEQCSYQNRTNVDDAINLEQQLPQSAVLDEYTPHVRNEIVRKNSGSYQNRTNIGEIRNEIVQNIYNKEKIKKENEESEAFYIKGEKEKKLLKYFSTRNLSLPGFDKIFYESFLEQDIDELDDDVIKSIKTVWNQLGYDEELPENNFIDLETFQKILYHSWEQLKQDYPDYSLTEEDVKNIFGFLVMEHEGENCLYIDPSKLQDITAPSSQSVQEKSSRNFQYADRTSRRLFIDCINEVAEMDEQLLTSSEFVALLLIDYANDHAKGPFSAELTKLAYADLLKNFSESANVPVANIQMLFKDLPQKHKVKISPQQLLPDKFFQYNSEHGEASKVEELFLKKLGDD